MCVMSVRVCLNKLHSLHAKDYFKSCQEKLGDEFFLVFRITRTIALNSAVPQGSLCGKSCWQRFFQLISVYLSYAGF